MKGKFQYILFGAVITLLVIGGAFAFSLQPTTANESRATLEQQTEPASPPDSISATTITTDTTNETETVEPVILVNTSVNDNDDAEVASPGTVENPQTNIDEITKYVTTLITKQQSSIFGSSGWLHLQDEEYMPVQFRGSGEPAPSLTIADLHPNDTTILENWYFLDKQGNSQQRVFHTRTPEGQILQRVVTTKGQITNLTLQDADPNYEKTESNPLQEKIELHYNILYMLQVAKELGSEVNAWSENGKYIITITDWFNESKNYMNFEVPIWGYQSKYIIDEKTNTFFLRENTAFDGKNWFIHERITRLNLEIIKELPTEANYSLTTANEQK